MASMTVSGVVSGMDWEGMITQIIENAQKPAMVQVNKRTNLTNKKALFEEMQDLTKTLQSATTSLRFSSTYQAKNVQRERLDTNGSAKGVLTAKVNADAKAGVYNVEVKQLAQAYTRRSNRVEGNSNDILKGYAGTKLTFTQNGTTSSVEVGENDTLATLASRINNTVKTTSNPMNFTASVVDSRLIFKSDDMGRGTVKYADTLKYDGTGVTKLDDIDIDIDNIKDGDIVLTSKDGKTTYTYGTDFDIVNGNEIRWRTKDVATVDVGDSFTLKYTAAVGDTYTSPTIPRGSGSMDSDALTFTPTNTDSQLANRMTITDSAGFTYTYGTDFTFSGKSIKWLTSGNSPDAKMTYTVSYTAEGGEVFDVDASRGNTDAVTYTAEDSTTTNLLYADVPAGTVTIETEDGTTLYSGVDFDLVPDSEGNAVVQWNAGSTWTLPEPGSEYSLNITQGEGDTAATKTYTLTRSASDSVSLSDAGFSVANGSVSAIDYGDDEDIDITTGGMALAATVDGSAKTVNLTWSAPTSSTHSNLPARGDELSIEYRYSGNTFQIDDGGSGLLAALGLDLTDEDHLTEAQDAIVAFDGEEWNLVSNELDYENDILN
ncbi:MAG: hypothetical protein IJU98_00325, partial [Synergistaceae bacterium]|nr:hypothetical protein [Synergistaceae bacterium]